MIRAPCSEIHPIDVLLKQIHVYLQIDVAIQSRLAPEQEQSKALWRCVLSKTLTPRCRPAFYIHILSSRIYYPCTIFSGIPYSGVSSACHCSLVALLQTSDLFTLGFTVPFLVVFWLNFPGTDTRWLVGSNVLSYKYFR